MDEATAPERGSGTAPFWDAVWPDLGVLPCSISVDVAVVGAGITGAVAALELADAGLAVVVLTANHPRLSATARSTGKLSLLQGERLAEIRDRHGDDVLRQYVDANRAGMDRLVGLARSFDVPLEVVDDASVAYEEGELHRLDAVLEAAHAAGLVAEAHLPDSLAGALAGVRVPDQVQLDPSRLLAALLRALVARGVPVYRGARARTVRHGRDPVVLLDRGTVSADHVVLATGAPFGRLGGLFTQVEASRSYLTAWRSHDAVGGMSIGLSGGSVRTSVGPDGDVVLVGGEGHVVGRGGSVVHRLERLAGWAEAHVGASERVAAWGAQDYVSASRLPLVGPALPGDPRVLAATGFGKWGLTNGAAAGLALAGAVLSRSRDWAHVLDPWGAAHRRDVAPALLLTASAARTAVGGWARAVVGPASPAEPAVVCHVGPSVVARSSVQGRRRSVSAVCPHLGGIVAWNDAEQSWDCPVHGSRFDVDGHVIEGPATDDLRDLAPGRRREALTPRPQP